MAPSLGVTAAVISLLWDLVKDGYRCLRELGTIIDRDELLGFLLRAHTP
jgi:hypothetical protein